jgi:hypothetical protein
VSSSVGWRRGSQRLQAMSAQRGGRGARFAGGEIHFRRGRLVPSTPDSGERVQKVWKRPEFASGRRGSARWGAECARSDGPAPESAMHAAGPAGSGYQLPSSPRRESAPVCPDGQELASSARRATRTGVAGDFLRRETAPAAAGVRPLSAPGDRPPATFGGRDRFQARRAGVSLHRVPPGRVPRPSGSRADAGGVHTWGAAHRKWQSVEQNAPDQDALRPSFAAQVPGPARCGRFSSLATRWPAAPAPERGQRRFQE